MDWNWNLGYRLRDAHTRIALLQASQRRLARDIYHRFHELDMAIDQLQNYLDNDSEGNAERRKLRQKKLQPLTAEDVTVIKRPLSGRATKYLQNREYGCKMGLKAQQSDLKLKKHDLPDYVSQQLPALLTENEFDLGTINKVFASQWLNGSQVVIGTKCNKLLVLDVHTNNLVHINSIKSSPESEPAKCPCGIHSISINPSKTMIATGGENTNDLGIYELPTFDPLCIGEGAHEDWIFDMEWIDDQHIITGSRDGSVALWHVDSDKHRSQIDSSSFPLSKPPTIRYLRKETCRHADKVRALAVSQKRKMFGTLSMNAKFHCWDIETFRQMDSIQLPWKRENVCVTNSDDLNLFAIGSQAFVTTIDHRDRGKNNWLQIPSSQGSSGIRSLSFNNNVITIGTGNGHVLFYDMCNRQFLTNLSGKHSELVVGEGWLKNDNNYREHFHQGTYPNAVYTHCYDEDKVRMFVAGGPLPSGLYGNYAGLFY